MPKVILEEEAPQGGDDWYMLHVGRPTASNFHRVVTPKELKLSKQRKAFTYRLAAERLVNFSFDQDLNHIRDIRRGKDEEPEAVKQYASINDAETYRVSMILTDDEKFGCSPDRMVDHLNSSTAPAALIHGLEIKSVFLPKMLEFWDVGSGDAHRIQVLGQMWVGDMELNDLFCYNVAMKPYFCRWKRSEHKSDIETVRGHMTQFGDELDELTERMRKLGYFENYARAATISERREKVEGIKASFGQYVGQDAPPDDMNAVDAILRAGNLGG
jgi:hypothetical protein